MPLQPTRILTAEEVIASTRKHRAVVSKEQRDFKKKQAEQEAYQDLRDDVASVIKNSGMSYEDIHARCGPHPHTLANWAEKKVSKPQLGKMRSVLRVLGYDFAIVDGSGNKVLTKGGGGH